jgi:hypothetical protein
MSEYFCYAFSEKSKQPTAKIVVRQDLYRSNLRKGRPMEAKTDVMHFDKTQLKVNGYCYNKKSDDETIWFCSEKVSVTL